jgi:hypothetical protein
MIPPKTAFPRHWADTVAFKFMMLAAAAGLVQKLIGVW